MPARTNKYDLDLSKIRDEELVVLAQECGFRPAANELLLRYHQLMGRLIAYQARQTPLTEADVEDAKQNAVFALFEAIAGYHTLEMVKPGGCRFRSFARRVTTRRFWNFVKQIRRLRKRYHCSARASGDPAAELNQDGSQNYVSHLRNLQLSDPGDAAARRELLGRLRQVLERLGAKMQVLWQELAAGNKLRQIARQLGISYDAVKRQRRKLLAQLSSELAELAEPERGPFEN
jgi:RNA polymerase sigma factor (sigma-70 family)